jgi:hypothetical protein
MSQRPALFRFALAGLVLAACGASGSAPEAVQNYLQARAEADAEKMVAGSCVAWETQARTEADSFKSMNAQLEGVACTANGADGDATLVTCTGKIITTYNGEQREWDMTDFTFKAVQEGGEWRMCGYQ